MPYSIASEEHHVLSGCVPAGWEFEPAQRVESTAQEINKFTERVPLGVQRLGSRESAERPQQRQPDFRRRSSPHGSLSEPRCASRNRFRRKL